MTMANEITKSETETTAAEVSPLKEAQSGCCGGAAPQGADACCALDASIKSTGGSGCGCAPREASGVRQKGGCC
jgi:hypothetical protein